MSAFCSSRFSPIIIAALVAVMKVYPGEAELSDTMVKIKNIKDRILNGYDKLVRPTQNGTNTTIVNLALWPYILIGVDETKGVFSLDSTLVLSWHDPRLMWSKDEYRDMLPFPQDTVWLPDISVHNSHSLSLGPESQTLVECNSDGTVSWYPPIHTQTSCEAVLEATYPYEEIECSITMGSWVSDGWATNGSDVSVTIFSFQNNHQRWELLTEKVRLGHDPHPSEKPYTSVDFIFPIRRRPVPEIEATRVPCILVMLLTLSVFWLPPNSSKKILVLGFQLQVLVGLIAYVAWSTKSPAKVLFATTFLQSTMCVVTVTFLLQILIIFNLCNLSGPARPPALAMQLLNGALGKYACLRWPRDSHLTVDKVQLTEDSSPSFNLSTPKDDWILFAAGLDRLFFVLVSIAMIAVHHL